MRILIVKSVSDEIFKRLMDVARKMYEEDDLYVLLRERELEKVRNLFPDGKFITFGGDTFNAFRIAGELKGKILEEGIERVVVFFRDEYGARYFHYRLFPLLLGFKLFISINGRGIAREYGTGDWWRNLLLEETRARFLSLFYLLDKLWLFAHLLFSLGVKKILQKRGVETGKEKRVLFFITSLGMGGAQRQLYLLTKELLKRGYQVDIVCIWRDDALFENKFLDLGVDVAYLVSEYEYWFASKICKRLQGRIKEGKYSIIHNWMLLSNVYGSLSGTRTGHARIVNSIRTMDLSRYNWYEKWYRLADSLAFRLSDLTLVNSHAVYEDYRDWVWGRGWEEKIEIIYNGFDLSLFESSCATKDISPSLCSEKKKIGFFGRLSEEKDIFTFLNAVEHLVRRGKDFSAVVCGDGYQMSDARAYAHERGIDRVVSFLGFKENVNEVIKGCDVVVSTSLIEGLPNALIEAQLLGVPVVTTDAGGSVEVVKDGVTGFIVPRGSAEGVAEKVGLLLESDELRHRFGMEGEERARNRFSLENTVGEIMRVYGH